MEIKTVALMGAGAIGSYFIEGLSTKLGDDFCVVAEGRRAERLKANGINVNGHQIDVNVATVEEASGADLLIVAVKYGALESALNDIKKIVKDNTVVMTTLNGVSSEEITGSVIGMEHMVYSLMKISVQRSGNMMKYPDAGGGVFFGEADGTLTERVQAIASVFDGAVRYQIRDNILEDIWYKYALNISRNLPQAIINCGYAGYNNEHVDFIGRALRSEVVKVAAAKGIDISDETNPAGRVMSAAPDSRFSTLQDLDAGRETEIEMFSGTLVRIGRELGVETPYNEFAYHAIKALEDKNKGILV